ncbi:MAG: lipopolysaccharide biosynthesis, partial [Sphaerospermopsis kisseleviana]
ATFSLAVIGATVVSMKPDPPVVYFAIGELTYTEPTISFSKTGSEIQIQGRELNETTLLSDEVILSVAKKLRGDARKIVKNINIKLPDKDKSGKPTSPTIAVGYKDSDEN